MRQILQNYVSASSGINSVSEMTYIVSGGALNSTHSLTLASARLSKLWIPFQSYISNGDLCKNVFYVHVFSFLLFSNVILSDALILPVS